MANLAAMDTIQQNKYKCLAMAYIYLHLLATENSEFYTGQKMTRKATEHKVVSIPRDRISLSFLMEQVKGHCFSGDKVA